MKTLSLLLLILAFISVILTPAYGSKFNVDLIDEVAYVTITSSIYQNFTSFQDRLLNLSDEELEATRIALDRALKAKSNMITFSDLNAQIITTSNQLNVTIEFKAENISTVSGKIVKTNCSWRSFTIHEDLKVENIAFNLVGKKYIKPTVLSYGNSSWVRYYMDGNRSVYYTEAANKAGNATLLNFESLAESLTNWNRTTDLSNQETIWFLSNHVIFDLKVSMEHPNETKLYESIIEVSSEIVGPSFASIEDDSIVYTKSNGSDERFMLALVIASIIITISIYIYESKNRTKQERRKR